MSLRHYVMVPVCLAVLVGCQTTGSTSNTAPATNKPAAAEKVRLDAAGITAALIDKNLDGLTSDGNAYQARFSSDGRAEASTFHGWHGKGKWWLEGDNFCRTMDTLGKGCFSIYKRSEREYEARTKKGNLRAVFTVK